MAEDCSVGFLMLEHFESTLPAQRPKAFGRGYSTEVLYGEIPKDGGYGRGVSWWRWGGHCRLGQREGPQRGELCLEFGVVVKGIK